MAAIQVDRWIHRIAEMITLRDLQGLLDAQDLINVQPSELEGRQRFVEQAIEFVQWQIECQSQPER